MPSVDNARTLAVVDATTPSDTRTNGMQEQSKAGAKNGQIKRWLPLAIVVAAAGLAFAFDLHKLLSFKTIGLNYAYLKEFIARNLALAVVVYVLVYTAVVALSLPGALIMTLTGGLLFGWLVGAPATVIGATAGATLLFLVARSSFGEALAERAGPAVQKLRAGFQENAFSYMLFLRLVPVFPFVVVNLAAAVLGVPLRTYVIGTLLGIMPGTFAYTVAGSGLGSVIEAQNASYQACIAKAGGAAVAACPYTIDTAALVTRELVLAFALLGLVALIPVALKSWRDRNAKA
jgi:uncharacterized membrane protein YdjX (TVP38/TMEM64 family)